MAELPPISTLPCLFKNKNKKDFCFSLYIYIQQYTQVKYYISYTTREAMGGHEAKVVASEI